MQGVHGIGLRSAEIKNVPKIKHTSLYMKETNFGYEMSALSLGQMLEDTNSIHIVQCVLYILVFFLSLFFFKENT